MAVFPHFEIKLDQSRLGSIKMNGEEIKGVKSIKVEASVDDVTQVTLTMYGSVDMDFFANNIKLRSDEPTPAEQAAHHWGEDAPKEIEESATVMVAGSVSLDVHDDDRSQTEN